MECDAVEFDNVETMLTMFKQCWQYLNNADNFKTMLTILQVRICGTSGAREKQMQWIFTKMRWDLDHFQFQSIMFLLKFIIFCWNPSYFFVIYQKCRSEIFKSHKKWQTNTRNCECKNGNVFEENEIFLSSKLILDDLSSQASDLQKRKLFLFLSTIIPQNAETGQTYNWLNGLSNQVIFQGNQW